MLFRQVLHEDLGCASYVVADGGEAAVVDPTWEIERYLALAGEHSLRVAHILETHNHADHLSGHGRLAAATGAPVRVSAEAGAAYKHEPLRDGDAVEVGRARLVALATPGHRPEHLAFLVVDTSRADEPWLLLTGDSLFVGDLARPDLAVEPEEGARALFRSLRRLDDLPDFVEVWPGHAGGSLCGGGGTSEKPGSTLGFERRHNRFLQLADEDEFVRELTSSLAPQPPSFERIVELNRGPLVTEAARLDALAPGGVEELLADGSALVDGREPREFDAEHVPGAINVTATSTAVGTRAAWVVDLDRPVVLASAGDEDARRLGRLLEAVGFLDLRGVLAGGVPAWRAAGHAIETTEAIDVPALADRLRAGTVRLLDVRETDEWDAGHVEGSLHVPYHELDRPPDSLREGPPLAVACSAGVRSSIAVSLLRRHGIDGVVHVVDGGVPDLDDHGIELVRRRG
jgi:glyoxylase-like metal-dependent hydrolase (beta-lactamase superfamily II)/rhodanese-related sulfurtransferase